jgi:hypothetical protein
MSQDKCFYCDAPATRYCDFTLGGPIGGYERVGHVRENRFYACFDIEQLPYRCDIAMCEQHATQVGNIFMKGGNDTVDHCPEHVGKDDFQRTPCTEAEADEMRRFVRATAKRRLIREGNFKTTPPLGDLKLMEAKQ